MIPELIARAEKAVRAQVDAQAEGQGSSND
jgi:hypothetical protein